MKKFGKFLFGTLSLAAIGGALYGLYKNLVNKNADDDFDDFDDSMDDFDEAGPDADPENREYVSINITTEESKEEPAAEDVEECCTEACGEEAPAEEAAPVQEEPVAEVSEEATAEDAVAPAE